MCRSIWALIRASRIRWCAVQRPCPMALVSRFAWRCLPRDDNAADKATAAGPRWLASKTWRTAIKGGELDFDVVIATPDAMRIVGQLGQVLGPRGLMPNPKTGTVTPGCRPTAVQNAKAGQVQFRTDKAGIVHGSVGTVGFDSQVCESEP